MNTPSHQQPTPSFVPVEHRRTGHLQVLALKDARCTEVQLAGGKGARLALLTQQGFPVPPALVITSESYDEFVRPVMDQLMELIREARTEGGHGFAEVSVRIRELLHAQPLPTGLREELHKALASFPDEQRFSVRSSSTLEDLSDAAFAGMHETTLNCRGLDQLLEGIRSGYLSLWSERAIAYRHHKGFRHEESRMAIVIQSMVECAVAGVGFSIHPVSGDLQTMVINANPGLGEAVVNGEHEVDHFELNKATGTVTAAIIAQKRSKVVCDDEADGIREEKINPAEAEDASLAPWQLEQLSALLLRVEEADGFPQDIEWGFAEGALHLFQARAITRIPPRWTREESAERFPNVMTPLSWDIVEEGFHESLAYSFELMGLPRFEGKWFASHDHYIYGNQNAVELYLGRAPILLRNLEDLREAIPHLRASYRWVQDLPVTWSRDLDGFLLQVGRLAAQPVEQWEDVRKIWTQVEDIRQTGTQYFLPNIAISITQAKLHRVLLHLLGMVVGADEAPRLFDSLLAFCETRTWEINRELHDLASVAGAQPELEALILNADSRRILTQEKLAPFPNFARQFESLLAKHGHREPELDPYHPTWGEAPWVVLDHVRLILRTLDKTPTPIEKERSLRIRMHEAEATLFEWLPEDLHYFFRELIRLARLYTSLDDREHYQTTRLSPPLRRALRALGLRLVERGYLDDPMDVFFAKRARLEEAVAADQDDAWQALATEIKSGKEAYHRDADRRPDWVLGETEEDLPAAAHGQVLRGIPASPGTIEGVVCHVLSQDQFASVPDRAILVARTTNPTWTPLFHAAAGVITESGGPLSHGAVTAREMNIPAIMAVRDALLKLPDGQRVRMNGTSGEIQLL